MLNHVQRLSRAILHVLTQVVTWAPGYAEEALGQDRYSRGTKVLTPLDSRCDHGAETVIRKEVETL